VLFLTWAVLTCTANGADAKQGAQDVLARTVLRACLTALQTLHLDHPERLQTLEGRSCLDVPGLNIPGSASRTFPASRITLHPEAQEGVQVRVTSSTGR